MVVLEQASVVELDRDRPIKASSMASSRPHNPLTAHAPIRRSAGATRPLLLVTGGRCSPDCLSRRVMDSGHVMSDVRRKSARESPEPIQE